MANIDRHCIRCGAVGPFRNELALRCVACDGAAEDRRKDYHKVYQLARSKAMHDLIEAHRDEFNTSQKKYRAEIRSAAKVAAPADADHPVPATPNPVAEKLAEALGAPIKVQVGNQG